MRDTSEAAERTVSKSPMWFESICRSAPSAGM